MARVEVITGLERRRRWIRRTEAGDCRGEPGAVARRADVGADQIYRWRQQFARSDGFAQVLIAPPEAASARTANEAACAEPMVEIEFAGKTRVRIPTSIPIPLAASIIKALARR